MPSPALTRRFIILFTAGALGGCLGDLLHVASKTETYPASHPQIPLLGLPWFVPLLFGTATVAMGIAGARFAPRPGIPSCGRAYFGLAALIATWGASGFLPLATGGAKDVVLVLIAGGLWWAMDRTWAGLVLGLITSLIGTGVEVMISHAGVFAYTASNQNLLGVPSWLPELYFVASITVGNLGRYHTPATKSE